MKRAIAISLLLFYLFATLVPESFKSEVRKLNQLFEHYQEHKAETPSISIMDFWFMHYGEQFAEHRGDHNHSNLPGKESPGHSHAIACGCNVFALPVSSTLALNIPEFVKPAPAPAGDELISSLLSSGIWQPPRWA